MFREGDSGGWTPGRFDSNRAGSTPLVLSPLLDAASLTLRDVLPGPAARARGWRCTHFPHCTEEELAEMSRRDCQRCVRIRPPPRPPMARRHGTWRLCLGPITKEPSCLANAVEDDQFQFLPMLSKLVANEHSKRANQSHTERVKGWQNFRQEKGA